LSFIDLTGQCFGRWTVIRRTQNRGKSPYWFCQCKCGKTAEVAGNNLRRGKTQSCGCLRKEREPGLRRDLTGQRFGIWEVLESAGVRNGHTWWSCICDCGEERELRDYRLTSGQTLSCGCLKINAASLPMSSHDKNRLGPNGLGSWSNNLTWGLNPITAYDKRWDSWHYGK
jgi:hypothetical protein